MNEVPVSNLVFERDGTLSPEQLAGLPDDLRMRVTSPDFIEQARSAIRQQVRVDSGLTKTGRRESRLQPVRLLRFSAATGLNRKARRRLQAALRD